MIMKQPRKAVNLAEPVCYKYGKKGHYASHCRIEQDPTCYSCGKTSHTAFECRSMVDIPLRPRIANGLVTLLKTVSSRGATKQSKSKMRVLPRTASLRKLKEEGHLGRIISCT